MALVKLTTVIGYKPKNNAAVKFKEEAANYADDITSYVENGLRDRRGLSSVTHPKHQL